MQNSWRHPERLSPEQVHCWGTQFIERIQEDAEDLRVRRESDIIQEGNPIEGKARMLDVRKAYPRDSRPLLWNALKKFIVRDKMLNCRMVLLGATAYNKKTREGRSSEWTPERGLREGCPTPRAFQHLPPVRQESGRRGQKQPGPEHAQSKEVGGRRRWSPSAGLLHSDKTERFNSECETTTLRLSLFADDTTSIRRKDELKQGVNKMKRVMNLFKERNNIDKEEQVIFGNADSHGTRMLGSWLGNHEDLLNSKRRAGKSWGRLNPNWRKPSSSNDTKR